MSGHNKWTQIKHQKGVSDQKRGQLFSRLLRSITITAQENPSPDFNPRLRAAIEKAKANNVPSQNIERAISNSTSRGTEEFLIEAYGPGGVAILIEGATSNKNRTMIEVKKILGQHGGKLGDIGSVLWAFEKRDGAWSPKFSQSIQKEQAGELSNLLMALSSQVDVMRVATDLKNSE